MDTHDSSAEPRQQPDSQRTATVADWWEGARPHTWANAFAPVMAGTAAAYFSAGGSWPRALLALVVSWALIIGVNYANDYSDGIRGTDDARTGPQRLTGSGLAQPRQVKIAAFLAFGVAAIAGIALSLLSAWWLILVGACCIIAAWFYTGGSKPYGYRGLGEVAVFVFFGLVAVLGTEFTQSGRVTWEGVALAIATGAMSSAVNLANNLRDIPSDTASGKITLAVTLGDAATRRLWLGLIAVAFLLSIAIMLPHRLATISLCSGVFFFNAARIIQAGVRGPGLIPVLGLTGRGMTTWSLCILCAALLGS